MTRERPSVLRTLAGLALAIVTAPLVTALCLSASILTDQVAMGRGPAFSVGDMIGGTLTFLLFAVLFGSVLALIPGLVLGGVAIAAARACDTRSPVFFSAAGLLGGLFMAWVDTGRTGTAFAWWAATPFVVGGCLSALTYWAVAER